MDTSIVKPEIKSGIEEILNKVSKWEAPDVERLLNQMGSLLARKKTQHLSEKETAFCAPSEKLETSRSAGASFP